ncbi:hypothetical protein RHMOL_Rhmol11G0035300 [Rhododendron molle]|uniref:Uncharacterized protein n=1 Tax=Rhododendron molle TaxID=49168 RepID=A0ACC0LNI7_RHOML|nr:hypothetical protein RHMOL_Rhmol11G0035300 [Rhododendron molle]
MFPILHAFYGFFGALPPMEYFEVKDEEEEIGDEEVANEATLEEDKTQKLRMPIRRILDNSSNQCNPLGCRKLEN